jgi:uncharacterized protein (DUF305 family)
LIYVKPGAACRLQHRPAHSTSKEMSMLQYRTRHALATLVMALFIPTAPFAADSNTSKGMSGHEMGTKGMGSGASMDMHHSMMQGMKEMQSMKPSGDMDRDFATMMRHHHQQGVRMAEYELKNGKDKKMRDMAQKIMDTQKKEIAEFDEWLKSNAGARQGTK